MTNFKSGSGNLNFGGNDEDGESDDTTTETPETPAEGDEDAESKSPEQPTSAASDSASSETGNTSDAVSDRVPAGKPAASSSVATEYPYFVRRSNIGDERDTRLEIHVRDKVADQEATFRNELAEQLGASEVSKTDAREFALLAAFHHPERVAELMQDEGFGTLG